MYKYLLLASSCLASFTTIASPNSNLSGTYVGAHFGMGKSGNSIMKMGGRPLASYGRTQNQQKIAPLGGIHGGFSHVKADGTFINFDLSAQKDSSRVEKRVAQPTTAVGPNVDTVVVGNGATTRVPANGTATITTPAAGAAFGNAITFTAGTTIPSLTTLAAGSIFNAAGLNGGGNITLTFPAGYNSTASVADTAHSYLFPNTGTNVDGQNGVNFATDLAALQAPNAYASGIGNDYNVVGTTLFYHVRTAANGGPTARIAQANIADNSTMTFTDAAITTPLYIPSKDAGNGAGARLSANLVLDGANSSVTLAAGSKTPNGSPITLAANTIIPTNASATVNAPSTLYRTINYLGRVQRNHTVNAMVQVGKWLRNGWGPYVTAGVTHSRFRADAFSYNTGTGQTTSQRQYFNKQALAVGAGTNWKIDETKYLNLQYLYQSYNQGTMGKGAFQVKTPKSYHNVTLGLTVRI